jgi:vancomycin aglycone glucosyltransferase
MRPLISFNGTRGDAQPLMALGRALVDAGHTPVISGPPDFAAWAGELGLDYRPRGREMKAFMATVSGASSPMEKYRAVRDFYRESIASSFDDLDAEADGADMIVGAGAVIAAPSVAAARKLPYVYLSYCPVLMPSSQHPPSGVPWDVRSPAVNRILWAAMSLYTRPFMAWFGGRWRRERGLPRLKGSLFDYMTADPELAPPPPEFEARTRAVGAFHLAPEGQSLAPEVEDFLAAGPPPIYVGFGSMTSTRAERITRWSLEAAQELGCRLILASGWGGLGALEVPETVLAISGAPHLLLFPRVAGAVHHGGAGTTAACLRSGVPQWVVPHFKDQYFFGFRVKRAGLGPAPTPMPKLHRARITAGFRALLEDGEAAAKARALGETLRQRDALAAAVQALAEVAA